MNKPQGASMYESAKKIYPREIGGRFDKLSKLATVTLLGLFYVLPWVNWDERQAILFDLPARKFYILGLTLWPQDFPFLALLLIIAALSGGPAGRGLQGLLRGHGRQPHDRLRGRSDRAERQVPPQ